MIYHYLISHNECEKKNYKNFMKLWNFCKKNLTQSPYSFGWRGCFRGHFCKLTVFGGKSRLSFWWAGINSLGVLVQAVTIHKWHQHRDREAEGGTTTENLEKMGKFESLYKNKQDRIPFSPTMPWTLKNTTKPKKL